MSGRGEEGGVGGLVVFRAMLAGGASGSFWAWTFAGDAERGALCVALYALLWALVELVAYLRRHLRWEGR